MHGTMRPFSCAIVALVLAACILHSTVSASNHASASASDSSSSDSSPASPRGSPRSQLLTNRGHTKGETLNAFEPRSLDDSDKVHGFVRRPLDVPPKKVPYDWHHKSASPRYDSSRAHIEPKAPASLSSSLPASHFRKVVHFDLTPTEISKPSSLTVSNAKGKGDKGKEKERNKEKNAVIKVSTPPSEQFESQTISFAVVFDAFAALSLRLRQLKMESNPEVDESMIEAELKTVDGKMEGKPEVDESMIKAELKAVDGVMRPFRCRRNLRLDLSLTSLLNYDCLRPVEHENLKKEFDRFRGVHTPPIIRRGVISDKIDALEKKGIKAVPGMPIATIAASTTEHDTVGMVSRKREISKNDIVPGKPESSSVHHTYDITFDWFAGVTVGMTLTFKGE